MPHYDLIVIGSGPGGQKAALQAAKIKKKVAIIEQYPAVGGGCLYFGTIPSKSLRESIYRYSLSSRGTLGLEKETSREARPKELPDIKRLMKRRDRVLSVEAQVIFDQIKRNNIDLYHGQAFFISNNEIGIQSPKGKQRLTADYFVIAVGAGPICPSHFPLNGKTIVDSNSILNIKKTPRTMLVLGAGVIGCEYASMFSTAGTSVTLVDRRKEILASVDREIVDHLIQRFHYQRMELNLNCDAASLKPTRTGIVAELTNGKVIKADLALVALGRSGNTNGLGLENLGIELDAKGLILVDKHYRTKVENIYAVGDVVGFPALASTGMEQGRIATCHAFKIPDIAAELKNYPYGIYTIPEISMIGEIEENLKKNNVEYVVGRGRYRELARGQIVGDRWGLLKLLVDKKSLKLLGVHIIGDNAADLIHIGQAVMAFNGDIRYFIHNVFNYPTLAEAYKTAAFHALNLIQGATKTK